MLPNRRLTIHTVLKNWNSTLALTYSAASTDLRARSARTTNGSIPAESTDLSRSLQSALEQRSTVKQLVLRNQKYDVRAGENPVQLPSRLSASLQENEYVKVLMELTLRSKMDPELGKKLFTENILTRMELSTFIQGALSCKNLVENLAHTAPGSHATEIVFNLFALYAKVIEPGHLNALELHDLNLFVAFFIKNKQLRKAQTVLDFIVSSNNDQIPYDISTAIHYLQLRCGALPQTWVAKSQRGRALEIQDYSTRSKYKAFDKSFVPSFLEFLRDPTSKWSLKSTDALEATIVYSLGFMGQISALENYIRQRWGISLGKSHERAHTEDLIAPSSEILIAILTSFARNGQIGSALEFMDSFIETYEKLELDVQFWRSLFQHSIIIWGNGMDPKGHLSNGCWEVMREWHNKRGRIIKADHAVLNDRFTVLRATNNYRGAIGVIKQCLSQLRDEDLASKRAIGFVQKYFKLVLRNQAAAGCYHKSLQFIKMWAPNEQQASVLRSYFDIHRKRYEQRSQKRRDATQRKQKEFDDEEEDSMLLGRLW
ncbi:LAME_0G13234g1_1 [Lachancea meyersii CBS 8951]|uniref:ATPase expression protein 2, mitochondrial n=1 Tax=Lachancea meyersii CBS 8951 TaxID=1266667 RepID=A0A1G4KA01_9SACH|nr:LAME_0G13234g1_1 [Lachancea meyersii CBS 8951]